MNASDTARKRRAKTYFLNKIAEFARDQPSADCLSTTCSKYATCIVKFESYELRQLFLEGRNSYYNCVTQDSCGCEK
jgi:hypothetical protein